MNESEIKSLSTSLLLSSPFSHRDEILKEQVLEQIKRGVEAGARVERNALTASSLKEIDSLLLEKKDTFDPDPPLPLSLKDLTMEAAIQEAWRKAELIKEGKLTSSYLLDEKGRIIGATMEERGKDA